MVVPSIPTGITILYGSETGNAQDYAQLLAKKLKYFSLKPTLRILDQFPLKKLVTDTDYLIIVCSTTGQGELPRNAKKFMKFILKKKLPHDLLNHIKLTTFGIGDSSYPKFNYAIRKIHTRLLQLGCSELSPRCEADELSAQGSDGFYQEWEQKLIEALQKELPSLSVLDENRLLPAETSIEISKQASNVVTENLDELVSLSRISSYPNVSIGSLQQNTRVTATDHFQDVRHIIIESDDLYYCPGDTVALYPCNDARSVELLIRSQPHWIEYADKPLTIHGELPFIEGGLINGNYLTLRSLITHHLDIMSIPRRSFFSTLWHFTDDTTDDGSREKEKLKEFSRFEEAEELYDYANRPRRSILETILEFQDNLRIPLEYVLELFPIIKPRLFSIASIPSPTQVELVVAIVEYKTIIRRIRRGLCTNWLKSLDKNSKLIFSVHKSNLQFELPNVQNPPIIMIAPGTGIAPMKSLIQTVVEKDTNQDLYLFYGCRNEDKDYLFGDLWSSLGSRGKLKLFTCFSRDSDPKIKYVQHKLYQQLTCVGDLILKKEAIIFVCGSSGSMPREVRITLQDIISKSGNIESERAHEYLLDMENSGRYIQETW